MVQLCEPQQKGKEPGKENFCDGEGRSQEITSPYPEPTESDDRNPGPQRRRCGPFLFGSDIGPGRPQAAALGLVLGSILARWWPAETAEIAPAARRGCNNPGDPGPDPENA